MDAARWSEVERLYHAARAREASERGAFLAVACDGDPELHHEVESLLAYDLTEAGALDGDVAAIAVAARREEAAAMIGRRVGSYEVTALIGAGGMGEVYRARDTRLGRDVAIKLLPRAFAQDPERTARLEREAQVLASLNHPRIGAIYGLEDAGDGKALVMELVEGNDLSTLLGGGPLPIVEAVMIARQIAEALEAAHEQGVIHRDLKPANVKVRPDGTVKLLDFGLAKPLPSASTQSPALTAVSGRGGMGTPAYMSPEQARGQAVDRRTDIWAFGCVLYEMLTGTRAFDGSTSSDVIAAVLGHEPAYDRLPAATPERVRRVLRRCLEKDTSRRLRDIADARLDLDDAEQAPTATSESSPPAHGRVAVRTAMIAAAAIVIVAGLLTAAWLAPRAADQGAAVRMTALLPPGVSVTRGPGKLLSLALSPDGSTLVIAATDATGQRLYRRTLDQLEATPLLGTEGASTPFFSPDGAWVGFFADRRLKRVPASGGAVVDIAPAIGGYPSGASWGSGDRIVFAAGYFSPLRIVDASGGTPQPLTTLDAGKGHLSPEILPDGRSVLFNEGGWIHALDLASGRRTDRVVEGKVARYAPSGHLILSRGTTLLSAPFDPELLALTGRLVPVVEDVAVEGTADDVPHVAVSRAGTLAYVPAARTHELVLRERDGSERSLADAPLIQNPQFSPDGGRLVAAVARRAGEGSDLWMYDLHTAVPPFRLTSGGARAPVWTPDGSAVTYSYPAPSERSGIYVRSADGRGDARRIFRLPNFHWLVGWSASRTIVYGMMEDAAADGISRSSILAGADGGESRRVVGPGDTWGGRLSPDGRWLAYYTLDSGYFEIYVTSFPDTATRSLIAEGTDPAWSPDGSEIYYRNGSRLMAATLDMASGVRVLSHRLVVEPFTPPMYDDYAIHPNGGTLALVRPAGDARGREVTLVLDWFADLGRLVRR
jgi:Tol biopolymer transport system component